MLSLMAMPAVCHAAPSVELGGLASDISEMEVTVEYDGCAPSAMIPKTIKANGTKVFNYKVMATYEADRVGELDMPLSITPDASFNLSNGSRNITANVTQAKTSFSAQDVVNGSNMEVTVTDDNGTRKVNFKAAEAEGTIDASGITQGTWTGTLHFTIS